VQTRFQLEARPFSVTQDVIRSRSERSTETDAKHCGLVDYTGHCGAWHPLHLRRLWSPRTGFATLHRSPLIAKIQQAAASSRTFSFFKHRNKMVSSP
jgi:hypothetical protein